MGVLAFFYHLPLPVWVGQKKLGRSSEKIREVGPPNATADEIDGGIMER